MPEHHATYNGSRPTLASLAEAKRLPAKFLAELGLCNLRDGGVGITYYDVAGETIAVKRRTALKASEGSYWPKGQPLAAYGLWRLDEINKAGFVVLVEGESDCWALWHHGLPALGVPGSNSAKVLEAEHLACVEKVYVHREPDAGGATFAKGVADRLRQLEFAGKAFELRMPDGAKDPADLHVSDPSRFLARFQEAIEAAEPLALKRGRPESGPSATPEEWQWQPPIPFTSAPVVEPFPTRVFPPALKRFAEEAALAVGCPCDYVGLPMLVLAGAAVGSSRALEVKAKWVQRPLLYGAVVGHPGTAKTPAIDLAAGPVYGRQQRLRSAYDQEMEKYQEDLAAYKEAKRQKKGDPDAAEPEKPLEPVLPRVFVDDATCEALAPVLLKNPRGVVMIRDELAAWVNSINQYKGGKGADRQFWLKNWSGVPAAVDRKQCPVPIIIPHPFVSVVGGIQPDMLAALRDEKNRSDGFLDRILFSFPEPGPVPDWTWAEVPEETLGPWAEALERLAALPMRRGADGPCPEFIRLSLDARPGWQELMDGITAETNAEGFPAFLAGPWSKLRVYAARLALVLHLLRWVSGQGEDKPVGAESIGLAGVLTDY